MNTASNKLQVTLSNGKAIWIQVMHLANPVGSKENLNDLAEDYLCYFRGRRYKTVPISSRCSQAFGYRTNVRRQSRRPVTLAPGRSFFWPSESSYRACRSCQPQVGKPFNFRHRSNHTSVCESTNQRNWLRRRSSRRLTGLFLAGCCAVPTTGIGLLGGFRCPILLRGPTA